jgi:hypothetical protein
LIEVTVRYGLGNRMRVMASALALARDADQRLTVYWLKNKNLNCRFGSLFEPIKGVRVIDIETGRIGPLFSARSALFWVSNKVRVRRPHDVYLGSVELEEYPTKSVDLASVVRGARRCGIETYGRFYGCAPHYEDFKPSKVVLAEADSTAADVGADGLVGVHIRRTDNDAATQVSPVELFIERMRREVDQDPEVRFFLATDDPMTEERVRSCFPGKVTTRPKVLARDRAEGARDALVDMLVLSRCRLILGSYWSSFSETASELSGTRLEIVRTEVET